MHIHLEHQGLVLDWEIGETEATPETIRSIAALISMLLRTDPPATGNVPERWSGNWKWD